jgi:guanylate kinase
MKKMLSSVLVIVLFVSSLFADIYVVNGCSGAGKDTTVHAVCNIVKGIHNVPRISTRAIRPGERDGVDMTFVSKEKFARMESNGEIFQKEVVGDNFYGGDRKRVQGILNKKEDIIIIGKFGEINKEFPNVPVHYVWIFITKETQEKRLKDRNTETPEQQTVRRSRYDADMEYDKKYSTFRIDNDATLYENGVSMRAAVSIRKFVDFVVTNRQSSEVWQSIAVVPYEKISA